MAPDTSFLIVTWTAIALLALGLAGCLRAIRILSIKLEDRYDSPRRLQVGDALTLPPGVVAAAHGRRHVALLFATADCRVCRVAVDVLVPVVADMPRVELQVLWAGDRPEGYERIGLTYQQEVFEALKVPVTPLLVVVDVQTSTVVLRGLLGSSDELDRSAAALRRLDGHDHDDSMSATVRKAQQ